MNLQTRMVVEQIDLNAKINNLSGFLEDQGHELTEGERNMLKAQLSYMKGYDSCLKQRIKYYEEKAQ